MTRSKSIIIGTALLLSVSAGLRSFAQNAAKPQAPNSNQILKVDVDVVRVNATVTDLQNRVITGLEKEHFKIWEDKLEQKIETFSTEDEPVSLGIVFDVSGS